MVHIPMNHVWDPSDPYDSRMEWWIDTLRSIDLGVKSPIEVDRHPQIHGSRGQITCLGPILDPFGVHSGVLLAQNPLLWPINL